MSFSSTYTLNAIDNASSVVKNFTQNVTNSTTQVTNDVKKMSVDMKGLVTSVSAVATAGYGLYMSYDRVQDMSLQVAKANLSVRTSTEALEKAQANYDKVVASSASTDEQKAQALQELQIAQERVSVNTERATQVTENQQQAMVSFGLMVVPQAITMLTGLGATYTMLTGKKLADTLATHGLTASTIAHSVAAKASAVAQGALNVVMNANPILLVVTAIGALVAGLVWAYHNIEPFRNAVDWLGKTLMDSLGVAIKWVQDSFAGLWASVQGGVEWFLNLQIGGVRIGDTLKLLGALVEALGAVFQSVFKTVGQIWDATIGRILEGIGWLKSQLEGFWGWLTTQGGAGGGEVVGTFQHGGVVPQTGLAMVHAGETVLPAGAGAVSKISNNVTIQNNVFTKSASVTGSEIVDALMGMGIPRFARGGVMNETGLAILERGERVLPGNAIPTQVTRNYRIDASSQVNINAPLVSIRGGGGGGAGGMREMMMAAKSVVFDALRSFRITQTSSGALTSKVQTYSTSITTVPSAQVGTTGMVGASVPSAVAGATTIASTATPSTTTNLGSSAGAVYAPSVSGFDYVPYNRFIPMPY